MIDQCKRTLICEKWSNLTPTHIEKKNKLLINIIIEKFEILNWFMIFWVESKKII